jgi:hypothetical protein
VVWAWERESCVMTRLLAPMDRCDRCEGIGKLGRRRGRL